MLSSTRLFKTLSFTPSSVRYCSHARLHNRLFKSTSTSTSTEGSSSNENSWTAPSTVISSLSSPPPASIEASPSHPAPSSSSGLAEFSDLIQNFSSSPIEKLLLRDSLLIYVKRDDLLRLRGPGVTGNKARKMLSLVQSGLSNDEGEGKKVNAIVSHGGHQSNAMLALAAVARHLDVPFTYYCKKVPRYLRSNPSGNFLRAKSLGMEVVELDGGEYSEAFATTPTVDPPFPAPQPSSLWIPQGGASNLSLAGCNKLAAEIYDFYVDHIPEGSRIATVIPCGTGCTALLVHREIRRLMERHEGEGCLEVVGVGVCGGRKGIIQQMKLLSEATGGAGETLPEVIDCKVPFAKPDQRVLDIWKEMKEYGVFLDLIYGAPAWLSIFRERQKEEGKLKNMQILYVHTGGLEGISSQLTRYKHLEMVEDGSVQ
ncbi:hypothetical protein TrVE_jg1069 [Triparma verrucosa]|uniref:Tryptophan synthase beta chain-like PALP domain-containing protein n=1 Tax=Triparma verrucosa TaxID=1606542 RepID=A0A9W7EKU4_9STRA|nr:hypothetical protein TrVE_jg1069 [Triparma verrucosa]